MFNLGQGQTSFENINVTLETISFACLKASFIVKEDFITLCSETTIVFYNNLEFMLLNMLIYASSKSIGCRRKSWILNITSLIQFCF